MGVCVMRATGSVGSAIVKELMGAGHQISALLVRMRAPNHLPPLALRYIEVI